MRPGQNFNFFLISLIALPVFVIGLIGLYAINKDLTSYQLKARQTLQEKLAIADKFIAQKLTTSAIAVRKQTNELHARGLWGVRCVIQTSCQPNDDKLIDLIITYDPNGDQHYPPVESASQLYSESRGLKLAASALSAAKEKMARLTVSEQKKGIWTSFQSPAGHHLMHCWRTEENFTHCAALNREWLIKQISDVLKNTSINSSPQSIHLVSPANQILWQDKNLNDPNSQNPVLSQEETGDRFIKRQLQLPLYFWHLAIKTAPPSSSQYPITLLALILPLLVLYLIIARALFHSQRAALEDAEKRANFAASISHELRTPLTNLQLYADLICNKANDLNTPAGEAVRNYTKVIAAESTRLSELVNNALTLAKTTEDGGERQLICAIPDHIITETTNRLAPLLEGVTGKISYRLNAPKEVMIDRAALEQILVNLLDNARKYAKSYPIRLTSRQENNRLVLTVRDWGPAFHKTDISGIFSHFTRGKLNSISSTDQPNPKQVEEGFGLGLAVCKELAEANNGSISVEFADPGARFTVTLATTKPLSLNNTDPKQKNEKGTANAYPNS
jgi:signal transduction histidine kinase